MSRLVRCPDFRGNNVHKVTGADKAVPFIDMSSFQGVLISGVTMYTK